MRVKLLLVTLLTISLLTFSSLAQITFEVTQERVILEIDKTGDVYLDYNITFRILSGVVSKYVRVGMPVGSFEVLEVREVYPDGRVANPSFKEDRNEGYAVVITPSTPIRAGEERTYLVSAVIHDFIYPDDQNPGNVGLMFIPTWFGSKTRRLEVFVIFPPGVKPEHVRNAPDYDNKGFTEDGRLYYYWVREGLPPNYKFKVGVSFPREYVERVAQPVQPGSNFLGALLLLAIVLGVFLTIYLAYRYFKQKIIYEGPKLMVESLGVNQNLSPVEVAYLKKLVGKDISYGRIIAVLIASLSKKGVLEVESLDPLRIKVRKGYRVRLKSFEKRFLECIDREIDQDCLVSVIKTLHRRVEWALEGYSRGLTLNHYEEKVKRLWESIEKASPHKKRGLIRENLDWLLTDEKFYERLRRALRGGIALDRREGDVWVWVWTPYPSYPYPSTSHLPSPAPPAESPEIPVVTDIEKVADSIARSVEEVSSQVVRNVEDFADKVARVIVPSRPRSRRRTRRAPSVSCACVSCACACACVSCACACAGGGLG